jgi:hypothetical protein
MADIAIILDNVGNNKYAQASREFLVSPVRANKLKIILTSANQIYNIIKIKNSKSSGSESNRDISLQNYIKASDKTNLIIDIILDPPVILDGQTYFETVLEANSEMDMLFYVDQVEMQELLT